MNACSGAIGRSSLEELQTTSLNLKSKTKVTVLQGVKLSKDHYYGIVFSPNSHVKILTLVHQNVTVIGDRVFKDVI